MRPEIGTQANFRKKKVPRTYRYDSSLSPTLEWDGQSERELGEWLIQCHRARVGIACAARVHEGGRIQGRRWRDRAFGFGRFRKPSTH